MVIASITDIILAKSNTVILPRRDNKSKILIKASLVERNTELEI